MKEAEWDVIGLVETLKADTDDSRHVLFGEGLCLWLPDRQSRLFLFPERLVVRYRSPELHIHLSKVHNIETLEGKVRIEAVTGQRHTQVFLEPTGQITITSTRTDQGSHPEETAQEVTEPVQPSESGQPLLRQRVPVKSTEAKEKADRVVLTGRVGRDPEVRTNAKGKQVAKMPLAVHEGEKTRWHNIILFDKLAAKAAAEIHKGDLLTIVGYKHGREVRTKAGIKRTVEEIFAAAVQIPKADSK